MRGVALTLCLCLCLCAASAGAETRCGWYENPTPANHWLEDADGLWVLSVQGGGQAPGFSDLPKEAFTFEDAWVSSNGAPGFSYYGYGCACIEGEFSAPDKVLSIERMEPLPLARCEADPALPAR